MAPAVASSDLDGMYSPTLVSQTYIFGRHHFVKIIFVVDNVLELASSPAHVVLRLLRQAHGHAHALLRPEHQP